LTGSVFGSTPFLIWELECGVARVARGQRSPRPGAGQIRRREPAEVRARARPSQGTLASTRSTGTRACHAHATGCARRPRLTGQGGAGATSCHDGGGCDVIPLRTSCAVAEPLHFVGRHAIVQRAQIFYVACRLQAAPGLAPVRAFRGAFDHLAGSPQPALDWKLEPPPERATRPGEPIASRFWARVIRGDR
jgi:hypothetical protein